MTDKQKMIWDAVMEEWGIWKYQDWLHPKLGISKTELSKACDNALVCCPNCFEPVKAAATECPNCHFRLSNKMMKTLRDNTFETVVYGWLYRKKYEEAVRAGKIKDGAISIHYAIHPPDTWLVYIASIAFAAIIGGISYDAFKKLISKISTTFRNRFKKETPEDHWLQLLYNWLKDYVTGKRDPNSPIFHSYVRKGLVNCSKLMAYTEVNPEFGKQLEETAKNIYTNNLDEETILIPKPTTQKEPPKEVIENTINELKQEIVKKEAKLKQLQDYLVNEHPFRDITSEDNVHNN